MPIIERVSNKPYKWRISEGNLKDIANKEKTVPSSFLENDKFRINNKGIQYLLPLIQGESFPEFKNGLPKYEQLDLHLI